MAGLGQIGRYELRALIARGASGSVYLAYDTLLERTVALKTYDEGVGISGDAASNFLREVKAASKLLHPNVVVTYDGGLEKGVTFLAMELVDGVSLSKWLKEKGRPQPQEALAVLRAIANGLTHAHSHGIVHRDLKPANVLIPTRGGLGDAKITDFGIAKVVGSERTQVSGFGPGTPTYMAPEQIQGKSVDTRVDVFALGILAYELLTGSRPFEGEAVAAILYSILSTEPRPPSEVNPALPKAIDAPIARALAKDPERRTPDVQTLVAELATALELVPRRSLLVPALSALGVILLAVGAYQAFTSREVTDRRFAAPTPEDPDSRGVAPLAATATPMSVADPTDLPSPIAMAPESPMPTVEPTPLAAETPTASAPDVPAVAPATPEPAAPRPTSRPIVKPPPRVTTKPPSRQPPTGPPVATGKSTIQIISKPPGARVSIDGVPRGTTPLTLENLEPKTITVTVEFKTLQPASRTIRLQPGGFHTVHFEIH